MTKIADDPSDILDFWGCKTRCIKRQANRPVLYSAEKAIEVSPVRHRLVEMVVQPQFQPGLLRFDLRKINCYPVIASDRRERGNLQDLPLPRG